MQLSTISSLSVQGWLTSMSLTSTFNKYKPTLVVEWTYKHGAKDELILSCTEHIGPNDELKLRAPCGYYVQLYVSVHS